MRTAVLAVLVTLLMVAPVAGLPATAVAEEEPALVFQTDMTGEEVVPPVSTTAWGFVRFFFNEDRTQVTYTVDVKTLSNSLVAGADIHRGAPGQNGPVIHHLSDGNFIVTSGKLTLTTAELQEMASGNWYVSLKTFDNPDGELRGQIHVPANFLPSSVATPTVTPTATRPAASVTAVPGTPAPGRTSTPGTGTGVIRPPDTGDAGLAGNSGSASAAALAVVVFPALAWRLRPRPALRLAEVERPPAP